MRLAAISDRAGPRIAVVLFNLGGPDRPEAVQPFLFNLFNDPAIIGLPGPLRWFIARLIARRRAPTALDIYEKIGGGSPLLPNTQAQADALAASLGDLGEVRTFCCMRYWHPMADEVATLVQQFAPERIVLLPLYPQFSSTTTASAFRAWQRAARDIGLKTPAQLVCCYPTADGFISALASLVRQGMAEAGIGSVHPRVLFSAHGLPMRIVARGDPYPQQVEATAAAVAGELGLDRESWLVCYQSRVGPLEWIGPATDAELRRAAAEHIPVVVVPLSFVSEHSETLVELDIEYRHLAENAGIPRYVRVPAVAAAPQFIAALAALVRRALGDNRPVRSQSGQRICAAEAACCLNVAG